MASIEEKAKRGIPWLALSQIVRPVWEFVIGIFLARILSPREFGIVALGILFYNVSATISGFGISVKLVQKTDLQGKYIATAQTIATSSAFIVLGVLVLLAPAVSAFFNEPLAGYTLACSGLNFVFDSLGMVPGSLLTRQMQFKKIAIIEITSSLIYGASAIFLAWQSFGVWSLIFSATLSVLATALGYCLLFKYIPRFGWDKDAAGDILRFGGSLTTSSILNQLARNLDYFIIGKALGTAWVGLYKRAYDLAVLPKEKIAELLGRVFYPTICGDLANRAWVESVFLKVTKITAFLCFPALMGLVLAAPEFVRLIYGEKWLNATRALQIMGLGGLFYSLAVPIGSIIIAFGKTTYYLINQIIYVVLLLAAIMVGIKFGINGVAFGVSITLVASWGVSLYFCSKILSLRLISYFNNLKFILAINICTFIVLSLLDATMAHFEDLIRLLIKAVCIGMPQAIFFLLSDDEVIKELRSPFLAKIRLHGRYILQFIRT